MHAALRQRDVLMLDQGDDREHQRIGRQRLDARIGLDLAVQGLGIGLGLKRVGPIGMDRLIIGDVPVTHESRDVFWAERAENHVLDRHRDPADAVADGPRSDQDVIAARLLDEAVNVARGPDPPGRIRDLIESIEQDQALALTPAIAESANQRIPADIVEPVLDVLEEVHLARLFIELGDRDDDREAPRQIGVTLFRDLRPECVTVREPLDERGLTRPGFAQHHGIAGLPEHAIDRLVSCRFLENNNGQKRG